MRLGSLALLVGVPFLIVAACGDSDPNEASELSSPELNVLIAHVFGAAYAVTKDKKWITFGDPLATAGIESMYVGLPKQWNQASRSFGKYLGYRALSGAEL